MIKKTIFISTLVILTIYSVSGVEAMENPFKKFFQERKTEIKTVKQELKVEMKNLKLTGTPTAEQREDFKKEIQEEKKKLPKPASRQGTVDTISANSFIILTADGKKITVEISDKTEIVRKYWGKSSLSEFHQGDKVNVRGFWKDETKLTITALSVRNMSILKRNATFWGKIKSIDNQTFIIVSLERGELTVKPNSNTKIMSRNGKMISFSDLQTGHRVRVSGVWDSALKTLDEVKTIKDWSLPIYPTPTPKV